MVDMFHVYLRQTAKIPEDQARINNVLKVERNFKTYTEEDTKMLRQSPEDFRISNGIFILFLFLSICYEQVLPCFLIEIRKILSLVLRVGV